MNQLDHIKQNCKAPGNPKALHSIVRLKPGLAFPCLALLCAFIFIGCKKYAEAPLISSPSYIRVFNNLASTVDFVHSQQATPFLTFLADPVMDASGIPSDAAVVGDFLGTRQPFSLSYPINEANSSIVTNNKGIPLTTTNYEYPGNAHVLSTPVINGFDLSAWAQFPSGRHRIMFVVRPLNNIGFRDLSPVIRSQVLLDTTIDFQKGEVYTLEVVSRDLDNNRYGLYVRREQFIHQSFEDDKLYAGFINLSGKTPASAQVGNAFYYPDQIRISYSYNIFNDAASAGGSNSFYYPLPGYDNNYYTTLSTRMDTTISYLPLPLLPQSAFFYQGRIRLYNPLDATVLFSSYRGTLPYFSFTLVDANYPINNPNVAPPLGTTLTCSADPATFNTLNNYAVTTGALNLKLFTPNLNLVVNTGQACHIFSTLNILEIVYDRIYLMQIQRGFDEVPKN